MALPPPPTFAAPGSNAWIFWFETVGKAVDSATAGNITHNALLSIQGGNPTERYHLSAAQYTALTGYSNAPVPITVGASPFTYTNTNTYAETIAFSSGATGLAFQRGTATVPLITSTPTLDLSPGDAVIVTYTTAPSMTAIPR